MVMPKLEGRDGWVPGACWPVSLDSLASFKPVSDPASIKRWSVSKQSPSGFHTYLNTLGLDTYKHACTYKNKQLGPLLLTITWIGKKAKVYFSSQQEMETPT